jgi:hypothetical protein
MTELATHEIPANRYPHPEHARTLRKSRAIIARPVPAFYAHPRTLDDMVRNTIDRALDLIDIDSDFQRWGDARNGAPSSCPLQTRIARINTSRACERILTFSSR